MQDFKKAISETSETLKGMSGEVQKNTQKTGGLVSGIGKFIGTVGGFKLVSSAINMVTGSISDAVKRVDTLNNSDRVFSNMGFSAKDTKAAMESLNKSITGLPTPLDKAVQGVQLIASSTNDLGKSQKIFSALNNGILGFGGTTAQVENAVIQLSQSFSNGKVDAQTWNSMINSGLGPALNALAKQMGITAGQLKSGLSDGSISAEKFQDALIDLNENGGGGLKSLQQIAKDSTAGIGTGLSNMKTSVVRGVAAIITSINDALKNMNLGGIGQVIAKVGSLFENSLKGIAAAVPKVIEVISQLSSNGALSNFIQAAKSLGATVKEVFEVVAPVALQLFNTIGSAVFNAVMPLVNSAISVFSELASKITEYLTNTVIPAVKEFGNWITENKPVIEAFAGVLLGMAAGFATFKAITGILSLFESFKTALAGVKGSIVALNAVMMANPIALVIAAVAALAAGFVYLWQTNETFRTKVIEIWTAITEFLSPVITAISTLIQEVWGNLSTWWAENQELILSTVETVWNAISVAISVVLGIIEVAVTTVLTAIKVFWDTWGSAILAIVKVIWASISTTFQSVLNVILILVTTVMKQIQAVINTVMGVIKGIIQVVTSAISGDWRGVWEGIKTITSSIMTGIKDTIGNVLNTAKELVKNKIDSIKGFFTSIGDIDLFEIGKNVIQGLINGIGSMVDAVKNKISEVAGGIQDKITSALGIHSPSRWMRDTVGINLMKGLAIGINSEADTPLKAVQKVTESIKSASQLEGRFSGHYTGSERFNSTPRSQVESLLVTANNSPSTAVADSGVTINVANLVVRKDSDIKAIGQELTRQADLKDLARGKRKWDE